MSERQNVNKVVLITNVCISGVLCEISNFDGDNTESSWNVRCTF